MLCGSRSKSFAARFEKSGAGFFVSDICRAFVDTLNANGAYLVVAKQKVVIHSRLMYSFALLIIVILTTGGRAMAIEKAKYQALESESDFELRRYEPSIVAETLVDGEFDGVANESFRRLVAYINGKNRRKASISMTAPVTQEAGSEKISMTAPVGQEKAGGSWRITFLMPSNYTMETLPEPLDERVVLKKVPG